MGGSTNGVVGEGGGSSAWRSIYEEGQNVFNGEIQGQLAEAKKFAESAQTGTLRREYVTPSGERGWFERTVSWMPGFTYVDNSWNWNIGSNNRTQVVVEQPKSDEEKEKERENLFRGIVFAVALPALLYGIYELGKNAAEGVLISGQVKRISGDIRGLSNSNYKEKTQGEKGSPEFQAIREVFKKQKELALQIQANSRFGFRTKVGLVGSAALGVAGAVIASDLAMKGAILGGIAFTAVILYNWARESTVDSVNEAAQAVLQAITKVQPKNPGILSSRVTLLGTDRGAGLGRPGNRPAYSAGLRVSSSAPLASVPYAMPVPSAPSAERDSLVSESGPLPLSVASAPPVEADVDAA